jgi:hypothetical protein
MHIDIIYLTAVKIMYIKSNYKMNMNVYVHIKENTQLSPILKMFRLNIDYQAYIHIYNAIILIHCSSLGYHNLNIITDINQYSCR